MNKVYACIDGLANTAAVIDWAAWSAMRLDVPLELLHVLERHPERSAASDYSGAIGLGAQEALLNELSDLDAKRSKLAQEAGRALLAAARERASALGVTRLDGRMRHGELVETVLEMEPDARLIVVGEHHRAADRSKMQMDHHVERVIRAVKRPVLVVTGDQFAEPQCFVVAFDGSAASRRSIEMVARSPMLAGLPGLIAMAGEGTAAARVQLEESRDLLSAAGFRVGIELAAGEPEDMLPALVKAQGPALLVMGAYGHSRIRQFIIGSTTAALLRLSEVPVLILR